MRKFQITLIIALFISTTSIYSQKQWNLQDCFDYALENNIQVKREKLNTEIREQEYLQSKIGLLPNLNARMSHSLSSGRNLNSETYTWENKNQQNGNTSLSSSVTLFKGLQQYNMIQANEFNLQRSLANYEKMKNDITLILATSYLQILFDMELLDVSKNQRDVTMLQIDRTEKLVDVGNVAKGELLKIQAQLANENLSVVNAQNQLNISYLNLTQVLDLDSAEGFEILVPQNLEIENYSLRKVEEIYLEALQFMPEVKSAEYNLKAQEKYLSYAKGGVSPELYLSGSISSWYLKDAVNPEDRVADYTFSDQLNNNFQRGVQIGLQVPIFNGFSTKTSISKAKISVYDAQYSLEQTKQVLYKDIQQAYADAMNAYKKYESSIEAVKSNEEAFNYTQQKFEVGLVNSVDYNLAKNDLTKAQSDLLQAKYEYIFKTKIIDFYLGKSIVL